MAMKSNEHKLVEGAKSTLRAVVANALAEALINGCNNCYEEGHPLSLLQQQEMAAMHIMAYDNAIEGCEAIDLEARILNARRTESESS